MVDELRACVLSGGASLRMGRDKALLPHPSGGVWLAALVRQLQVLQLRVVVVSGHASHHQLLQGWSDVELVDEPPPRLGPLHAFAQVLSSEAGHPWLVCPVDMPLLTAEPIAALIEVWQQQPQLAAVADDGERLQPLLGIYPSGAPFQALLWDQLHQGNRRWLDWLERIPHQRVRLPAIALCNLNRPGDLAALLDDR